MIFREIWSKSGVFGLFLSIWSAFKLAHDIFKFELSFFFLELVKFWDAYPIRMVVDFFTLFSIEISYLTANILAAFIFYSATVFRSQNFFSDYLSKIWLQPVRKVEGLMSMAIYIPLFGIFLNLIIGFDWFLFIFLPVFISLISLLIIAKFTPTEDIDPQHLAKYSSLLSASIFFGLFYWIIGVILGAIAFGILFAINYAFL